MNICPTYPKIETLLNRDPKTYKVIEEEWRLPEFAYLANNVWIFTEKIDGTNVRVFWDGQKVQFRGRTDAAQIPPFLLERLMEIFTEEKLAEVFNGPVYLYGEGYGAHIQKIGANYIPDGVDFILFDALINGWWLLRDALEDIAKALDIGIVPEVGKGTLYDAVAMAKEGFKSQWGDFIAEGLVLKPQVSLLDRRGDRIIGKIKYRDFPHE